MLLRFYDRGIIVFFSVNAETSSVTRPILEKILINPLPDFKHIVWTYNMRRTTVLVGKF
jgi:hypothetical protein